jgi:large subunit ribosomal protein L24
MMAARLSDELREEHGRKSFGVRKGDTVELLRGDFKGHRGKVEKVNLKSRRLYIEGVTVQKADGSDRFYPVHPSNVMIVKMVLKDEEREHALSKVREKE